MLITKQFFKGIGSFFILVFVYSWILWLLAIILGQYFMQFPTFVFYGLAGFGPSLVGIILTYKFKTKKEKKDFWHRSYNIKQIKLKWYLAILFVSLIPILIAGFIDLFSSGSGIKFSEELFSSITGFLLSLIFLIIGVLAEEFGWRGYVLDKLQNKYTALVSSLILAFFWGVWHLPLFFILGTYQFNLGLGSLEFWLFFISFFPNTLLYTWIYNNTRRSILSAIILHFCINFFGEIFSFDTRVSLIRFLVVFIISIAILMRYGYQSLHLSVKL